ncbi:hypothetical protein J437_LFUL006363 [Ladona fulva]|uniref:Uncharacterized protein n=1 Tax=Ladona fulva TaxID=123851 RepID=A0A8K0NXV9_LADFU|nr:hypothetical protein J437_LFUL006363 [Ladona fulva]
MIEVKLMASCLRMTQGVGMHGPCNSRLRLKSQEELFEDSGGGTGQHNICETGYDAIPKTYMLLVYGHLIRQHINQILKVYKESLFDYCQRHYPMDNIPYSDIMNDIGILTLLQHRNFNDLLLIYRLIKPETIGCKISVKKMETFEWQGKLEIFDHRLQPTYINLKQSTPGDASTRQPPWYRNLPASNDRETY